MAVDPDSDWNTGKRGQDLPRLPFFYRLSLLALLLAVLMSALSGYLRVTDSGIDCQPWPSCFGTLSTVDRQPGITIDADDQHKLLRVMHRGMASVFGIIATVMLVVAIWYRNEYEVTVAWCTVAWCVTVLLALVGMKTPDAIHPIVAVTNLGGGMLLALILFHMVLRQRLHVQRPARSMTRRANQATLTLAYLVVLIGGWVSATHSQLTCSDSLSCDRPSLTGLPAAFTPGRTLTLKDGKVAPRPEDSIIPYLHQALAPLLGFAVLGLGSAAAIAGHAARSVVIAPLLLMAIVMLRLVEPVSTSILSATLHNLLSLMLMASIIYQIDRSPGQ